MKYTINPNDVEPIHLTGREMRRLITSETVGAERLTVLAIWVQPGSEVLPCHSHQAEEAAYIVHLKQSRVDVVLQRIMRYKVVSLLLCD